jgi:hypothetical protein
METNLEASEVLALIRLVSRPFGIMYPVWLFTLLLPEWVVSLVLSLYKYGVNVYTW